MDSDRVFHTYSTQDANGVWAIPRPIIDLVVEELGYVMTADLMERFATYDVDRTSFDELLTALEIRRQAFPDAIAAAFRDCDADGDGFLDADEFAALLTVSHDGLTQDEARRAIDECDTDGDGRVSLEDFKAFALRRQNAVSRSAQLNSAHATQRADLERTETANRADIDAAEVVGRDDVSKQRAANPQPRAASQAAAPATAASPAKAAEPVQESKKEDKGCCIVA